MSPLTEPSHRLLVVDDDAAIRDLVTTRLTLAGNMVFTARDGREALDRLRERRYDGMVLDLNMPQLDGFGVLTQMKSLPHRPATLVLTARHNAEDVKRAIRLGARDYLAKPFDDRKLLMRVARLFRQVPVKPAPGAQTLEALLDEAMESTALRLAG